jgi:hypothetical protein
MYNEDEFSREPQGNPARPPRPSSPAAPPPSSSKRPSNAYHSRTASQTGRELELPRRLPSPSPQFQAPAKIPSRSGSPNPYLTPATDSKKDTSQLPAVNYLAVIPQGPVPQFDILKFSPFIRCRLNTSIVTFVRKLSRDTCSL